MNDNFPSKLHAHASACESVLCSATHRHRDRSCALPLFTHSSLLLVHVGSPLSSFEQTKSVWYWEEAEQSGVEHEPVRSRLMSRQVAVRRLSSPKVSSEWLIPSERDGESSRRRGQTPGECGPGQKWTRSAGNRQRGGVSGCELVD